MAATGLGELTRTASALRVNLGNVNKDAGHRIGRIGNDAVKDRYTALFGSDHRFSNARGSRTAGRKATVRYRVQGDTVSIDPSGDPIYIRMRGRGRHRIRPRKGMKHGGLRLPDGQVRRAVTGGRMAPDPGALDPAVKVIADRATREMSRAIDQAIRRSL